MRLRRRLKVPFTDEEAARLKAKAQEAGMTDAKYMRQAVLAAMGEAEKPKQKKGAAIHLMIHLLSVLIIQMKKLGTNINQLAHQANAGMVPVSRAETQYMLNAHQILLSKATAAVESLLA
jgi:hypothetical protein